MPYLDQNGDVLPVDLGRLERKVVRDALNAHRDELEKLSKKSREKGVPNPTADLYVAVIDGGSGWGQSLVGKFGEQPTLGDEAASAMEEQAATRRRQVEVEQLNEALAYLGHPLDHEVLLGWTPEQRSEVRLWAVAWGARGRNPEDPGVKVPETPLVILDELAVLARLEREQLEGEVASLAAALAAVDITVPTEILMARTPTERAEALAWAQECAPVLAAYVAEKSEENDRALQAVEDRIPEWVDANQLEPADADDDVGDGSTGEADDDEWTAQPGELRAATEA